MTSTSASASSVAVTATVLPKLPVAVDSRGRVRASKEQRRIILAEFERSGLSAAGFARRAGLKYSTFAFWVQRYRRTKRPARRLPLRLLEAVVALGVDRMGLADTVGYADPSQVHPMDSGDKNGDH